MNNQRALVTGSEGFVGRYLCAYLEQQGYTVRGCDRQVAVPRAERFAGDISQAREVEQLLEWAGPVSQVFHLAAITYVPEASAHPAEVMEINLGGTIHLANALRKYAPDARLVFASSAEVYGPPQFLPLTEEHPLNPQNPYAISKAAAEQYCAFFHQSTGLDVVRTRAFNHSGPGQSDRFVLSSFAHQVAEIEKGLRPPVLHVGNLQARRDFLHVQDVVRAYELVAREGPAGEVYNLCSGHPQLLEEALHLLLSMSPATIEVRSDPARLRPVEVPAAWGSYDKIRTQLHWEPEIPFAKMLEDLLHYWRQQ